MGGKDKVKEVVEEINKELGSKRERVLQVFGLEDDLTVPRFSTGLPDVDRILGGGIPAGSVIEVFGWESVGKTTFAIQVASSFQKAGKAVLWFDFENCFYPEYARDLGLDVDTLLLSQPESLEKAYELALKVYEKLGSDLGLIVVDSLASALVSFEVADVVPDDERPGLFALRVQTVFKRWAGKFTGTDTVFFVLNQVRDQFMKPAWYGERTPGGAFLKFIASVRLQMSLREKLKDGSGIRVEFRVVKNKFGVPFRSVILDLVFGRGFVSSSSLLDRCLEAGIIKQKGRFYYLVNGQEETRIAGSREEIMEWLERNEADIRSLLGS